MKNLIITERSDIVAIANAVRANLNTTGEMTLNGIVNGINNIATNASGGIDTSDATATANEIFQGETAYVDGEKITGTFTIDDELTTQDNLISQIQSAVDNLPEAGGAAVETCTVTLISKSRLLETGALTQCIDGTMSVFIVPSTLTNEAVTIENVVCNSAISFVTAALILPAFSATEGAQHVYSNKGFFCFKAPSIAGANSTIAVWDED